MEKRIISATAVLGLVIVGGTLAQQTAPDTPQARDQPKPPATDKVKLRAEVAQLRAEVELLELVHEADKEVLVALLKEVRSSASDADRAVKARELVGQLSTIAAKQGQLEEFEKKFGSEQSLQAKVVDGLEQNATTMRAEKERKKQAFVKRATELAEKRLELAETEKRYNEAK